MAATTISARNTIDAQLLAIEEQCRVLRRELRNEVDTRLPIVGGAAVTTALTTANTAIISATTAITTAIGQL